MATEERWVSVEDVATHLGVAKDSVYRWIDEKGLPAHRVGRLFRFKLSEVDEWVHQGGGQETASHSHRKRASSLSVRRTQTGKTCQNPAAQKGRSRKSKKSKNG